MIIVHHDRFFDSGYAEDNAAMPGRMEAALGGLSGGPWDLVAPSPASDAQLLLAHDPAYLAQVAADPPRDAMARLAAGGAILAARLAHGGEPAFACVRPPGHHAARDTAWGHCTFSNVALALLVLRAEQRIDSALVLDIDAHTGDGTRKVLAGWPGAEVFNPFADDAPGFLARVAERLEVLGPTGILAVSAGFDGYRLDVGRKLDTPDYRRIGALARQAAERACRGRRFAVLEGGYYLPDLGANVLAFCQGLAG
jgi:acetoin utilization deacetylase AcuC-like enzyme